MLMYFYIHSAFRKVQRLDYGIILNAYKARERLQILYQDIIHPLKHAGHSNNYFNSVGDTGRNINLFIPSPRPGARSPA